MIEIDKKLRSELFSLWHEKVESKYLYRGMSSKDLNTCLDPSGDPLKEIRPELYQLIEILEKLLEAGFEFTVHEDYSGMSFDLRDILNWSKHDLNNPGIDFTSNYEHACGYCQNFQGSQLKQNFRYITNHLPARKDDKYVKELMSDVDWQLVAEINNWLSRTSDDHKQVVIWVRRSASVFESDLCEFVSVGSFEYFCKKAERILKKAQRPFTIESVVSILNSEPNPLNVRLRQVLQVEDIYKIEETS